MTMSEVRPREVDEGQRGARPGIWQAAKGKELDSWWNNGMYEEVYRHEVPRGTQIVGSRFVGTVKTGNNEGDPAFDAATGEMAKERLVLLGLQGF